MRGGPNVVIGNGGPGDTTLVLYLFHYFLPNMDRTYYLIGADDNWPMHQLDAGKALYITLMEFPPQCGEILDPYLFISQLRTSSTRLDVVGMLAIRVSHGAFIFGDPAAEMSSSFPDLWCHLSICSRV